MPKYNSLVTLMFPLLSRPCPPYLATVCTKSDDQAQPRPTVLADCTGFLARFCAFHVGVATGKIEDVVQEVEVGGYLVCPVARCWYGNRRCAIALSGYAQKRTEPSEMVEDETPVLS